ncbi:hypothetical protein LR69_04718 [Geobacillus sp. BCO2]|nr:hypothetical protein LR69_04718 [Geobacillus sp. BCO2]
MQQAGGHYIVGEKMRSGKAAVEEALSRRGRYQQVRENLHIKEIIVGDGEARQRYVLVYNPSEAERQRKERETLLESLKEELEGFANSLMKLIIRPPAGCVPIRPTENTCVN